MTLDDRSPEARLRALSAQPVDSKLASVHLGAMAGVAPGRSGFVTKLRLGVALFVGLLIGGTGLAAADVLPASVQSAAHTTLAKVGVNVPPGHDRVTEGCGTDTNGQPFKNHGQYVKAHPDDPQAAASDCGKPKVSVHSTSTTGTDGVSDSSANAGKSKNDKPKTDTTSADAGPTSGKSDNAGSGSTSPGATRGTPSPNANDKAKVKTGEPVPSPNANGNAKSGGAKSHGAQP